MDGDIDCSYDIEQITDGIMLCDHTDSSDFLLLPYGKRKIADRLEKNIRKSRYPDWRSGAYHIADILL